MSVIIILLNIKMDLTEIRCKNVGWIQAAQDEI
jgi:hypothetical protein